MGEATDSRKDTNLLYFVAAVAGSQISPSKFQQVSNMAQSTTVSQRIIIIVIFTVYLVLKLDFVSSTNSTLCSFPSGSIACKVWNYTNMDCTWREFVCIPPLRHKVSLKLLDLSKNELTALPRGSFGGFFNLQTLRLTGNYISAINEDAFIGLNKLRNLDLSENDIEAVPDNVFKGLNLLQTLSLSFNFRLRFFPDNVFSGLQNLVNLDLRMIDDEVLFSKRTFNGLSKLQTLDLSHNYLLIPDSPFQGLLSLQTLHIPYSTVNVTPTMFDGINRTLQFLSIGFENNTVTTESPFVQLSFLNHLELHLNKPKFNEKLFYGLDDLKYLILVVQFPLMVDFGPLMTLTNLLLQYALLNPYYSPDSHVYLQSLNSLNAPLHALELVFPCYTLDSTTFEALPDWKESLKELTLHCNDPFGFDPYYGDLGNIQILIEGSPFTWFPKLYLLCIQRPATTSVLTSWTFPNNTFLCLTNLKELHLNYLSINNNIVHDVLNTFVMYNYSLEVLDLAHNRILFGYTASFLKYVCKIPTLKTIDVSIDEYAFVVRRYLMLFPTCKSKSNLVSLKLNNAEWSINVDLPNLISFHSSNSLIYMSIESDVLHVPQLQELHLSRVGFEYISNTSLLGFRRTFIKILKYIVAPRLKILDLNSNQISVIDTEDAQMLKNVSYLDLRNNLLTSASNLIHLHNVKVVLLGGNQITTVPRSILSNNPLQILDLHDNVLTCECNVEGFQKWVLTDEVTFLWNNFSAYFPDANRYKCVEPQSRKGLSITEIDLDCEVPLLMYISVGVTSLVVTIIVAILVIRYRWHIQYRLFLLFNRRAYQNHLIGDDDADDDFEDQDGVPRYDAYVIYHNQDEDWVDEQLVANIEEDDNEPFRLCLKNRDIRAGRLIFNELSLHIRRSRKSLVILTPRFVEDNWCYFQLNMAHHRVLEENHNVLIFIILEEIPDRKLTLLLRQLFCKSLCIKWPNDEYGQNLFWRRLREELKRPVPRDRINRYRLYNM